MDRIILVEFSEKSSVLKVTVVFLAAKLNKLIPAKYCFS